MAAHVRTMVVPEADCREWDDERGPVGLVDHPRPGMPCHRGAKAAAVSAVAS